MCDHGRGLAAGQNRRLGRRRRGVAYEARGYKQAWADERAGRRASRRPKSSQKSRDFGTLTVVVVGRYGSSVAVFVELLVHRGQR